MLLTIMLSLAAVKHLTSSMLMSMDISGFTRMNMLGINAGMWSRGSSEL
jgi:hypothetical protein